MCFLERLTGRWVLVYRSRMCCSANARGPVESCNSLHGWHPADRLFFNPTAVCFMSLLCNSSLDYSICANVSFRVHLIS